MRKFKDPEIFRKIVHKFSLYTHTAEEMNVMLYGLDHSITTKAGRNTIRTEFEQFFQCLLKDISKRK